MRDRKILVFGGAGFLGSAVTRALIADGYEVGVFDSVIPAEVGHDFTFFRGDITDAVAVADAVRSYDVVYNFAAVADLNEGLNRPLDTVLVNIYGNTVLLDACVKGGVSKFIYASSVYVNSRDGGFYRCSKAAAEDYVREYAKRFDLEFRILRYGSLYGPGSDITNGLYRIIKSALDTGFIRYQGSPEAIREYIHVVDAARASVHALEPEFAGKSVVLTGHEPMKVSDLLAMLAEIMGPQYVVDFEAAEYVGHYVRTPYAMRTDLSQKYKPSMHVDMGQGLVDLVDYVTQKDRGKFEA